MSELVMEHGQFRYHLKFYLRLSVGFSQWDDYFFIKKLSAFQSALKSNLK